jgi:hypothetical protein
MQFMRQALRNPLMQHSTKKQAAVWTASKITQADLNKVKKNRFLAESGEVASPGDEIIPCSIEGFRLMFLSNLQRGFSLPAHKFLCGLLFVYGVQLYQLTPNSILIIACFITLCEAFLGVDPH